MQIFQHMDVRCPNTYCIPPHVQLHLCMFASIRGNIQLLFEMFYLQLPFSYYKKKNKKNDENSIKKKYNISQSVDSIKLRILSPKHLTQMFYSTHSELPIICSALCTGTKVVQCMWL